MFCLVSNVKTIDIRFPFSVLALCCHSLVDTYRGQQGIVVQMDWTVPGLPRSSEDDGRVVARFRLGLLFSTTKKAKLLSINVGKL